MIDGAIAATEANGEGPDVNNGTPEGPIESGFKLKRKKRAEKPALVTKPGEVGGLAAASTAAGKAST